MASPRPAHATPPRTPRGERAACPPRREGPPRPAMRRRGRSHSHRRCRGGCCRLQTCPTRLRAANRTPDYSCATAHGWRWHVVRGWLQRLRGCRSSLLVASLALGVLAAVLLLRPTVREALVLRVVPASHRGPRLLVSLRSSGFLAHVSPRYETARGKQCTQ